MCTGAPYWATLLCAEMSPRQWHCVLLSPSPHCRSEPRLQSRADRLYLAQAAKPPCRTANCPPTPGKHRDGGGQTKDGDRAKMATEMESLRTVCERQGWLLWGNLQPWPFPAFGQDDHRESGWLETRTKANTSPESRGGQGMRGWGEARWHYITVLLTSQWQSVVHRDTSCHKQLSGWGYRNNTNSRHNKTLSQNPFLTSTLGLVEATLKSLTINTGHSRQWISQCII